MKSRHKHRACRSLFTLIVLLIAMAVQADDWTSTGGVTTTPDAVGVGLAPPLAAKLHVVSTSNNSIMQLYGPSAATNGTAQGVLFTDTMATEGYCCGVVMNLMGNSIIRISNLQIGQWGTALLQSLYGGPLILNGSGVTGSPAGDVVIGYDGQPTIGLRVRSSGNSSFAGVVGIGTTTPAAGVKLQVEDLTNNTDVLVSAGDNPGVSNSPTFSLMHKDGNDAQTAKYGLRLDATDNKLKLLYGAGGAFTATPLVVDTSGNIGIGTSTPRTPLHIIGAFDNSSSNATRDSNKGLTITSSAAGSSIYAVGNKFGIVFAASNGTTTNNFPVSGIMAIPDAVNAYVGGSLVLQTHTMNDATLLERVRITSDGKVGIGLTNPSQQLSVAGTIQTSVGVLFPDGLQTAAYPFSTGTNAADLNRNVAGALTSSVTNTSSSGSANLSAIAGNGISYLRLASNETPATREWRLGMMDSTGVFTIRDVAGVDRMTISGSAIHFNGNVDGTTIQATYQDVAEWVPTAEAMAAGTVVVVGIDADNTVTTSTHAYDTSVAGVVSANPGLLLGVASASKAKIATTGRVRVRVDATKSPIRKGDLLVTSDRPGMAMKSEPLDLAGVKLHRPGTLIGKALEPLAGGEGEILVLLSLQ